MEELLRNWNLLIERWNREHYAGLKEKDWDKIHKRRDSSRRIRNSMGASEGDVFPGKDELDQLSRGMEEDKSDKPQCVRGNGAHSLSTGEFVSPSDEKGSWSSGYWSSKSSDDCMKGKYRRPSANNAKRIVRKNCGREDSEGRKKAKIKCGTGEVVETLFEADEDGFINIHQDELDRFILEQLELVVLMMKKRFEEENGDEDIQESSRQGKIEVLCRKQGFQSFNDFLSAIDKLKRSFDGRLRDKPKGRAGPS
jgi:hypothetical protein